MQKTINQPDYDGAISYALDRLERDIAPDLSYHNIRHTRDGVMKAAVRLAGACQLDQEDIWLLMVAAAFHDIGFLETREGHETAGVRIINQVLPDFGFCAEQIERMTYMILATRLPQSPNGLVDQILADADLDVLGREDFFERSELLRLEMAVYEKPQSPDEWYQGQLDFLAEHRYFTAAARELRDGGKEANREAIKVKLGLNHRSVFRVDKEVRMKQLKIAELDSDAVAKIRSLEKEFGKHIMAFEPGMHLTSLSEAQLVKIRELEEDLGVILLAYDE
jgi:predicted metal-dependent HD superfamily phosphohydrolase